VLCHVCHVQITDDWDPARGAFARTAQQRCRALQCLPLSSLAPNADVFLVPRQSGLGALLGEGVRTYQANGAIEVGDVIVVQCRKGFRYNSVFPSAARNASLVCEQGCQQLQTPEQAQHSCVPVMCPALLLPAHASLRGTQGLQLGNLDKRAIRCDLGYKVKNTACETSFEVECVDGLLRGARECVPIQCGCGSASCPPLAYGYDAHAQSWSPHSSILHGSAITVTCAAGYRASSAALAQCVDSPTFQLVCNDCVYAPVSNQACTPVACVRYEEWPWYDRATMKSIYYYDENGDMYATIGKLVPFNTRAIVTCNYGYRYSSHMSYHCNGSVEVW
jgi:hypothetical protein